LSFSYSKANISIDNLPALENIPEVLSLSCIIIFIIMKYFVLQILTIIIYAWEVEADKPAQFPDRTYATILMTNNFDNPTQLGKLK